MAAKEPNLAHFLAIPWCAKTLNSPGWTSRPVFSRTPKPDTEDELFARTLHTPTTISHMLFAHPAHQPDKPISYTYGYATLAVGLNGFADVCHGGIVATLIDEIQGMSLTAFRRRDRDLAIERGELEKDAKLIHSMTGELTVRYIRPVKTPQTVLVVTKVKEVIGRKLWMDSEVLDGEGVVLATGKGLFIQVRDPKDAKL
jgi:acyl-coenzyme A thioesterase PaaI-like protein